MHANPSYALDLSQEDILLWFKGSDGAWLTAGSVPFDDPKRDVLFAKMRAKAGIKDGKLFPAQIRIPRSEVLVTKINVPADPAGANQQIVRVLETLTPYKIDELSHDVGVKSGQMTPIAAAALETLQQADDFAREMGFEPTYFTAKTNEAEFPDQPQFFLKKATQVKPVVWVAGAAVTFGVLLAVGALTLFSPSNTSPDHTAQTPPSVTVADISPADGSVAPDTETFLTDLELEIASGLTDTNNLHRPEQSVSPDRTAPLPELATAGDIGTTFGPIDLPPPPISSEPLVAEIEPALPQDAPSDETAALSDPTPSLDIADVATSNAIEEAITEEQVASDQSDVVAQLTDRLIPTVEGTLGPEGILIFAGRPPNAPPARSIEVASNPLAEFKPLARPKPIEDEVEEAIVAIPNDEETETAPLTLLDLADPTLAGLSPIARPQPVEVEAEDTAAIEAPELEVTEASLPTLLDLADPELAGLTPLARPIVDTQEIAIETPQPELSILEQADPLLAGIKPLGRPAPEVQDVEQVQVDETLAQLRPLARPSAEPIAEDVSAVTETTAVEDVLEETVVAPTDIVASTSSQDEIIEQDVDVGISNEAQDVVTAEVAPLVELPEEDGSTDTIGEEPTLDVETVLPSPEGIELSEFKPIARDNEATPQDTSEAVELASIDPALVGARPSARPANIATRPLSILQRANPELRGNRPSKRPAIVQKPVAEPVEETKEEAAPNPIDPNATKLAIIESPNPKSRPRGFSRTVKKTQANIEKALETNTANTVTPTKPKRSTGLPTTATVAKASLENKRINKRRMNLIGVYGKPTARSALVRMPNGRYVKVKPGQKFSGWKVAAIGDSSIRIKKGSKTEVLRMPRN